MPNLFEQAGAKVASKLGGIRASLSGLTGVFRKLAEEHKAIELLLERALVAEHPDKRADLWITLRAELVGHERAEIELVYPELMTVGTLDAREDHEAETAVVEALISRVDELAFDSPKWRDTMEQLARTVTRHAEREEAVYFPKVQAAIGEARAKELELPYSKAKLAVIHDLD